MLSEATLLENHTATTALTVIVADDVISSQQSARTWLEEQGHHVFCAASGPDGTVPVLGWEPAKLPGTVLLGSRGLFCESEGTQLSARARQPTKPT